LTLPIHPLAAASAIRSATQLASDLIGQIDFQDVLRGASASPGSAAETVQAADDPPSDQDAIKRLLDDIRRIVTQHLAGAGIPTQPEPHVQLQPGGVIQTDVVDSRSQRLQWMFASEPALQQATRQLADRGFVGKIPLDLSAA